jgi:hypothetical protein
MAEGMEGMDAVERRNQVRLTEKDGRRAHAQQPEPSWNGEGGTGRTDVWSA